MKELREGGRLAFIPLSTPICFVYRDNDKSTDSLRKINMNMILNLHTGQDAVENRNGSLKMAAWNMDYD